MNREEYIYRKQNNICIVCGGKELYDDRRNEYYCPRWERL